MGDRKELPTGERMIAGHRPLTSPRPASDGPALQRFDDVASVLMMPGGLLDRAEETLERSLATDPKNTAALRRLAIIRRCKGDLPKALQTYGRLVDLQPDDGQARYLHAVLSGNQLPPEVISPGPAPFVRIEQFLTPAEHDLLVETAHQQQSQLNVSNVGKGYGHYDPEWRSSLVLRKKVDELIPWFLPRIKEALPDVLPRLQVPPFTIGWVELQMTVHRSGGFYKIHRDSSKEQSRSRRVTYVYYFHRLPKRFTGGDLLLYDTNVGNDTYAPAFTRIEALDNSVVFFPSIYYHQVTTVQCETDDFADGRFTLNGWFHPLDSLETEHMAAAPDVISRDPATLQRD